MTSHPAIPRNQRISSEMFFIGLTFITGTFSAAIYPVLVQALLAGGYASNSELGILATAEFLCFGLAALLAGRFIPGRHLRRVAAVSLVAQIAATYLTAVLDIEWTVACRAMAGIADGILIWMAYDYISRKPHPGRIIGILTALLLIFTIVSSQVAETVILTRFGYSGVIVFLTAPALVTLLFLPLAPNVMPPTPEMPDADVRTGSIPLAAGLVLFSAGLWAFFVTIFWVFSEPLASARPSEMLRHWLTWSLIAQIVGSSAAAYLAERISFKLVISFGLLLCAAQLVSILIGVSDNIFLMWVIIFGFLSYFLNPFYVTGLMRLDPSGQGVVYFPAVSYLAGSVGPIIVAQVVSQTDLTSVLLVDLVAISLAPIALWIALVIASRKALLRTGREDRHAPAL